ncbi:hypothetical protein NDU88_001957 [Pleurodeles waltl]|uniref:Uncharacterized protein n=1 Tax=Pleurodeles waltl TaxID=8319 RepID=A0AAV7SA90_PLEWA|nr:hypothetical protein NDU88_001957 [Pleurodeles waltl]
MVERGVERRWDGRGGLRRKSRGWQRALCGACFCSINILNAHRCVLGVYVNSPPIGSNIGDERRAGGGGRTGQQSSEPAPLEP